MTGKADLSIRRLRTCLRRLMKVDPWVTLAVLMLLTDEQWMKLLNGQAFQDMEKDVQAKVRFVLRKYPMDSHDLTGSTAHDVLLKLSDGRFLKRYRPRAGRPWAYVIRCAFNYARSEARSIWRKHRRNRGNDLLEFL